MVFWIFDQFFVINGQVADTQNLIVALLWRAGASGNSHRTIITMANLEAIAVSDSHVVTIDSPASFLIVQEDAKMISRVDMSFRSILQNFNVTVAQNSEDIRKLFRIKDETEFDLIVLDNDYKELKTYFLLKLFREDARFEYVPIIILCESADDELISKADEYSATIVTPKKILSQLAPLIFQQIMDYWMTSRKDLYVYRS